MASEQVVTKAEVQGQSTINLPIILNIGAELEIAEVPDVSLQMSSLAGYESGIHTGILLVWRIRRKVESVEKVIRRTRNVELAIFKVALEVCPDLDVMRALVDRDHVSVVVDVLLESLWVAVVGPEADAAVIKTDERNAWNCCSDPRV